MMKNEKYTYLSIVSEVVAMRNKTENATFKLKSTWQKINK